jgi:hypothetical protein
MPSFDTGDVINQRQAVRGDVRSCLAINFCKLKHPSMLHALGTNMTRQSQCQRLVFNGIRLLLSFPGYNTLLEGLNSFSLGGVT